MQEARTRVVSSTQFVRKEIQQSGLPLGSQCRMKVMLSSHNQ
jgi:hypothetical protein